MTATQHELLTDIPVLRDLTADEIAVLDSFLSELWLEPGDVLFEEGDDSTFVGFLLRGRLEVVKRSMTGETRTIAGLPQGSSIGEMSMLDDLKRSATVRAGEKSLLRLLRRDDFEQIVAEQPAIATKILRYIARSLSLSLRKTSNVLSDTMHL